MFHVYKYIYIVYTHLCKYIERESEREREREHVDLRIDLMRSKLVIYFDFNGYYVYIYIYICVISIPRSDEFLIPRGWKPPTHPEVGQFIWTK